MKTSTTTKAVKVQYSSLRIRKEDWLLLTGIRGMMINAGVAPREASNTNLIHEAIQAAFSKEIKELQPSK
jgi:hypothetical protein